MSARADIHDTLYESYKKKCAALKIEPSPKTKIFAEFILKQQNDTREDIVALSQARREHKKQIVQQNNCKTKDKEFDSIEHEYDYYEAMKFLKQLCITEGDA